MAQGSCFSDHKRTALSTLLLCLIILGGVGGLLKNVEAAAPTLTEISASPNPALTIDNITVTSDAQDLVQVSIGYQEVPALNKPMDGGTWGCMAFAPNTTGTITSMTLWSDNPLFVSKFRMFAFENNNETGALLASAANRSGNAGTQVYYTGLSVPVEADAQYWACMYISHFSGRPVTVDDITDGNYLRIGAGEPVEYSAIGGTLDSDDIMPVRAYIDDYTNVQIIVKRPSGDYTSDYIAKSDYAQEDPSVTFVNPCATSCVLQAKAYNVTNGYSSEVQTTLYLEGFGGTDTEQRTGIYITATDWQDGTVSGTTATDYSSLLHNWRGFAGTSVGGNVGRILVDGTITTTCNYEWDCQLPLDIGTHTYTVYSANGGYQYTGTFTIDLNTTIAKIYVPLTYNIFKIWDNETMQTIPVCTDIYSLSADGVVGQNKRIGTGLYVGTSFLNWDTNHIVPQNCYSTENIPAQYPFALPGNKTTTEPLIIAYSGSTGIDVTTTTIDRPDNCAGDVEAFGYCWSSNILGWDCPDACFPQAPSYTTVDDGLLGIHFPGSISGTRNRNGYSNFYSLYEDSDSSYSGYVERKQATAEDGYYSPVTNIASPSMNVNSALYGDANYNPGDFALYDSITCEASLLSGGYSIYDVNMLLISDKNAIYGQHSFTPFQKYNMSMSATQDNGAFNIVWHTFENVNIIHSGTVQCAIQTTNELGYKSGWVYSAPRTMYSTNLSSTGGMNVFVKYEDGTTSYMGHNSPFDSDLNNIDIYNWYHQPYYWGYDTSDNPLTLFEGDGVIAQTWDRNASRSASKSFDIDRGDAFDITLYLADPTDSDQSPVILSPQMFEQSAFGDRVYCKNVFYDKDLDWNSTKFSFWTSNEGSLTSPLCEKTLGYAYTTNCNPTDSPCLTPGAGLTVLNECGSDNDCYTEAYFSKRGCASLASGSVTGYCGMRAYDNNGNSTLAQASAELTVPVYQLYALCESYTLLGAERDSVIFTDNEQGYVECLIGLDNVAEPTDLNWTVVFEGRNFALEETLHDDYMDHDYFRFRIEATTEIEALARARSTDNETWEGDGTVFVQHPVYGSEDTAVHLAVVFVGKRESETGTGEYGEEEFSQLWDWVSGFGTDLMTDPIGTVQARFFEILVLTTFAIIFVPLLLIGMVAAAKAKKYKER